MLAHLGLVALVALLTGWLFALVSTTRLFVRAGTAPGRAAAAGALYATLAMCELPVLAFRAAHEKLDRACGAYAARWGLPAG